ncbi:type II toxin-antitoxin system RelE/ParE family toxin [Streptococcus hyointestinalis]|uniref:type II toxin-antitoxin system RelE/ParE family toxin n=1 Tax=Streptococcus hyointestinalis TaxID=1337 RepID=UPI0013DEE9C6|nr:type II toxin-antitoxin system RelE/ParE family toxin [Streptococcus hyointestinalis]
MDYKVSYNTGALEALVEIKEYIINNFKSETSAKKVVDNIMQKISALEIFPEVGFDADERFGKTLDKRHKTRGLTIGKDYIALYFVDDEKKEVIITHIVSTRSDYVKLFK